MTLSLSIQFPKWCVLYCIDRNGSSLSSVNINPTHYMLSCVAVGPAEVGWGQQVQPASRHPARPLCRRHHHRTPGHWPLGRLPAAKEIILLLIRVWFWWVCTLVCCNLLYCRDLNPLHIFFTLNITLSWKQLLAIKHWKLFVYWKPVFDRFVFR